MQAAPVNRANYTKNAIAWVNVVAGALLFVAPWVLGYANETAAFVTHLVLGALIAVVALLAATTHHGWSWVNVAAAVYVIIAALVIGGSGSAIAAGIALAVVAGVVALTSAAGQA